MKIKTASISFFLMTSQLLYSATLTAKEDECTKKIDSFLSGLAVTAGVPSEEVKKSQQRIEDITAERAYKSDCEVYAAIPEIKQTNKSIEFALEQLKKKK